MTRHQDAESGATHGPSFGIYRFLLLIFAPFTFGYFLNYLLRNINATLAPLIAEELQISALAVGAATAAFNAGILACLLPAGALIDRFGPRRVQIGLLLLTALACVAFAFARTAMELGLARGMIGVGCSGALLAALKAVALWSPPRQLHVSNGLLVAFGTLGAAAATAPIELLLTQTSWRGVFIVLSASAVTCAAILVASPEHKVAVVGGARVEVGYRKIIADRRFRSYALLSSSIIGSAWAMQGLWAGIWLRDVNGLERSKVVVGLLTMALVLSTTALGGGAITGYLRRRGLSFGTILAAIGLIAIAAEAALIFDAPLAPLLPWTLVVATGAATVVGFSANAAHFPSQSLGRANAALNIMHMTAAVIAQAGFGLILDMWEPGPGRVYPKEAYSTALAAIAALQAVALCQYWIAARRRTTISAATAPALSLVAERSSPNILKRTGGAVIRAVAHVPAIAALMGFQLLGEAIVVAAQLKFPGALLGMLLLLAVLIATQGAGPRLGAASLQLSKLIGLMVLPAGAAIGAVMTSLGSDLAGIALSLVISTLMAIATTGLCASLVSQRRTDGQGSEVRRAWPIDIGIARASLQRDHRAERLDGLPARRDDVEQMLARPEPEAVDCSRPDRPYT